MLAGVGGIVGIKETRLMARALMQRWEISQEQRADLIQTLMQIATDVSNSPRERTTAIKAIISAEKQNQEDEHKVIDVRIQQRNNQLDAIAADLGIEADLIEDAARKSGLIDSSVEESETA
jgi:hypothetical protein